MSQPDLIIHDEKDNVGVVVVETTKKGQECSAWIMENDKTVKVNSINEVPLGHKIALQDLKEGDTIYFDKSAAHRIEIDKEVYHVIRQENVVVVL